MCTKTQFVNFVTAVCIPSAKKKNFTPHIRNLKLRDPAVSKNFQDTFKDKVATLTPGLQLRMHNRKYFFYFSTDTC